MAQFILRWPVLATDNYVANLKCLALSVPEIAEGYEMLKSRSYDPDHAPLRATLSFWLVLATAFYIPNRECLCIPVPEIEGDPKFKSGS